MELTRYPRRSSHLRASFLDEDFLLHTNTARLLYHEFAEGMPIIDYHLPSDQLATDKQFDPNLALWGSFI